MYIYLDESYNLKDRSKKQLISINGFAVLDIKILFKKWKECRRRFIGKRRIHATDSIFDKLRSMALKLMRRRDMVLLSVFQAIQEIPFQHHKGYFYKNKLNFEKIYLDLLKALLLELNLEEFRKVEIILHSRKYKGRVLNKPESQKQIKNFLHRKFPQTNSNFKHQTASTDVLLELADFVSNIFYRAYITDNKQIFESLKFQLVQIKNPL